MNTLALCPTILAQTPADYDIQMRRVVGFAKRIQIDISDGVFSPIKTISLSKVWWPHTLNADIHLMVQNPEHYQTMLAATPPWQRLWIDGPWASQLVHVGNYTDLLAEMKPDSIPRMAAFISIIRPGKAHLQRKPWAEVFASVWDGDESKGYTFKHSHAISYAALVALHMNLLDNTR